MTKSASDQLAWDHALIEQEKRQIKSSLDLASQGLEPDERMKFILQALSDLAEDHTSLGRLRRYIYAISALVQYERSGGLPSREIPRLMELAHTILRVQGVKPRASRLAGLFGDLHMIKSQIDRKEGLHWRSAWEQEMAWYLAGSFGSGGIGFQMLCMGNRALRLGQAHEAIARFEEAQHADLSSHHAGRVFIGLCQAFSLSQQFSLEDAIYQKVDAMDLEAEASQELGWLRLLRQARASGDYGPLLKAVGRNGDYFQATYIIEASLWCLSLQTRSYLPRLPKLGAMRRNRGLAPQKLGSWYELAVCLEECYDSGIPLIQRIRRLGEALDQRSNLLTIEKELLVLAAAVRWLSRIKSQGLAKLVYGEYRGLSLRLSGGQCSDALGVLADIQDRDWSDALNLAEDDHQSTG